MPWRANPHFPFLWVPGLFLTTNFFAFISLVQRSTFALHGILLALVFLGTQRMVTICRHNVIKRFLATAWVLPSSVCHFLCSLSFQVVSLRVWAKNQVTKCLEKIKKKKSYTSVATCFCTSVHREQNLSRLTERLWNNDLKIHEQFPP